MRENLAGDYYLVSDITFPAPGTEGFPAEGFEPVGRDTEKDLGDTRDYFSVNYGAFQGQPFTGSFDGNGHTIRNFSIQRPDEDFIGLFGQISAESKITNVRMEDVDIRGKSFVGAIVGLNRGGSVSGVVVRGTLRGTEKPVQLIKKRLPPQNGNAGGRFVGGLVGANSGTLTGSVQMEIFGANDRIGGLVGSNVNGTVKGHAAGTVEGGTSSSGPNGSNVGGLVGWNKGGTVIGYSSNTVQGLSKVGGLAGYSMGGNARIIGYSTGNITGKSPQRYISSDVGGLAGGSQGLVSGYATGEISSYGDNIGGLVGQASHKSRTTGIFRGTIRPSRPGRKSALLIGLVTAASIPGPSVQGFHSSASAAGSTDLNPDKDVGGPILAGVDGALIGPSGSIRAEDFTSVSGTNYGHDYYGSKQYSNSEYSGFVFGSDVGQWTFHAGKWPSINLGSDPIFANTQQPIKP